MIYRYLFVSNISEEMIGLTVNGFTLRKAQPDTVDGKSIIFKDGERMDHAFIGRGYHLKRVQTGNVPYYLFFDKTYDESIDDRFIHDEIIHLIHVMRVFTTSSIGFVGPLGWSDRGSLAILGDIIASYHSAYEVSGGYFRINQSSYSKIDEFYRATFGYVKSTKVIQVMLQLLDESYKTHSQDIKTILRTILLEMLISSNAELRFRLGRHIAVLFGKTIEDSRSIFENMKKLYDARSQYLHTGKIKKYQNTRTAKTLWILQDVQLLILWLLMKNSRKLKIALKNLVMGLVRIMTKSTFISDLSYCMNCHNILSRNK